jgi:hypothetical protein
MQLKGNGARCLGLHASCVIFQSELDFTRHVRTICTLIRLLYDEEEIQQVSIESEIHSAGDSAAVRESTAIEHNGRETR